MHGQISCIGRFNSIGADSYRPGSAEKGVFQRSNSRVGVLCAYPLLELAMQNIREENAKR